MRLRAMTCLPGIAIEPEAIDLGNSRIARVPFDVWLALEGQSRSAAYDRLATGYAKNPPVFWEIPIDADRGLIENREPDAVRSLMRLIESELEVLVKALHWYTGVAPIDPRHSVTYFDSRSAENFAQLPNLEAVIAEAGVQRRYGESGKEYATRNEQPSVSLRLRDGPPFVQMLSLARLTQEVWSQGRFEAASKLLVMSSMPGLGWPTQVLLMVVAYEALLLSDRTTELQKRFERRFSAAAATRFADIALLSDRARLAYQLRSDLTHGRSLKRLLAQMPASADDYVENFSRIGVIALCRLIRYRGAHSVVDGDDPLPAALDAAAASEEGFAALQAMFTDTAVPAPIHQWQIR